MPEKDFADLADMFKRLPAQVEATCAIAVRMAADQGADHARQHHTYKDRSGTLSNSIDSDGTSGEVGSNNLSATISAGASYAVIIEKGSVPHVIEPRFKKMLRFPVEGGFVFRRRVQHPGTKAMPFIEPAAEYARGQLENELLPDAVELAFVKVGFV